MSGSFWSKELVSPLGFLELLEPSKGLKPPSLLYLAFAFVSGVLEDDV